MSYKIGEIVFVLDNYLSKEGSYGIVLKDVDGFVYIIFDNGVVEFVGNKLIKSVNSQEVIPNKRQLKILYKAYKNFCIMHDIEIDKDETIQEEE